MRTNLPVTQQEYMLRDGSMIVSKTDVKGRITYVNDDFVEASGFTEAELMGQPHNLVRHPDMPEEGFADLWATLKRGDPWTGLVKNRRKNGDHYWVVANATPIREGGVVTGYMSVRSKPTRDQVAAADAAYRLFKEGQARGKAIRDGHVVNTGWLAKLGFYGRMTLAQKFAVHAALLAAPFAAALALLALPEAMEAARLPALAGIGAVFALGLFTSWRFVRGVGRSLRAVCAQTGELAQGHFEEIFDARGADEIADLRRVLQSLRTRLGFELSDTRRNAATMERIKQALDNVATNVMVADKDHNIIYMNQALVGMFGNAEQDIRKDLPGFDAGSLIGTNIDKFHKNPTHQRRMLDGMTGTHRAVIHLGGRTFNLAVTPVRDASGARLGSAVEWLDRTAEVATEKEINEIVTAASAGDFTRRVSLEGKQGFFRALAEGMNRLLDNSAAGLDEVARVLGALAKGDLTEKIVNDYAGTFGQLKDDSNRTVAQLTEIVSQIKEASDAIGTSAKEISQGNSDLSSRTEEQASSLEETASSMEELTSTVKQNAENAKQANQLAAGASDIAVKGGQVVGEVVGTMNAISESSKKIVDIISVIDGIAFQTNILALNAAVEAARAGEQGRGFAVVASEVRNLAQRSAAAAKEIKALISDSVEKVDSGTKLVDTAGSTMEEIVQAVKRVTDIMGEITAASMEQSSGIEQVNQAITQMDQVTQQNAALVEQVAATAESLQDQAQGLINAVAVFKLEHAAQAAARAAPAAARRTGNVTPMPAKKPEPAAAKPAARPAPRTAKVAGGDDEWEEF